jgi:glycosyltransferase involved in cell wall biosynthesis
MNIHFLTCARYPTKKAYGVTIGNTMFALSELGISNSIVTLGKYQADIFGNTITSLEENPIRIPRRLYNYLPEIFARTAYMLNQLIYAFYFSKAKKNFEDNSYFWTREPITLLVHSLISQNSHYLIELHHSIGKISRAVIKQLARKNEVKIIVLNKESEKYFSKIFSNIKVQILALGVPRAFIDVARTNNQKDFLVGYLGKGISNGHDNELAEIVYACKDLYLEKNIKFTFIGLEPYYKKNLKKLIFTLGIEENKIFFIDHVVHSQVSQELAKLNLGILPYPESTYNAERVPLKALEYAAIGLPIVATDTKAHRSLLNETFTLFYKKGDSEALARGILRIKNDDERNASMSLNAREFSRGYTYDERALKLLQFLRET